ncbi:MarR family transcriptional regulator [Streptomyces hygroscopicus]|uniref:MarR family winged helix-turn-helix transcriptional regulator n=1 Tax=Streptomyces hygroscopicus TaxID=1912 RepID=UPI00223E9133|nr:MarR family transcriptional regulator [Streptomyces hygroscopicus]MCW7946061.1 MarR family transcriptional regulator [Streptomyces hygroscopicus]
MADSPAPADQPGHDRTVEDGLLPPELRAWMQLLAAAGAIEQRLRSRVKDALGVTHDEFLVLCLLADQPGAALRMSRIAEALGRPKTRLTYQIACLHHADLVTRRSVCGDKRGIEVALTDKGRQLLREVSPTLAETVTEAVQHMVDHRQCETLRGLLPGTADTAGSDTAQRCDSDHRK